MIEGDEELCTGCRTCEIVCALSLFNESNPEKSAIKIMESSDKFEVCVCNQCGECIRVCPEGALIREGYLITLNSIKCTGCYICVEACPMGALFTHPDIIEPFKCTQCEKCVDVCPVNALSVLNLEPSF
ncbi:MAG: 4Fe-4S binding protein [Theionarchaea archaeon]|nr:4Fe-4S binding protein [Theionarchaea archaeon]